MCLPFFRKEKPTAGYYDYPTKPAMAHKKKYRGSGSSSSYYHNSYTAPYIGGYDGGHSGGYGGGCSGGDGGGGGGCSGGGGDGGGGGGGYCMLDNLSLPVK
ncbi:hypothetical protein N0V84_010479 [Fusarium piperis]|uniref:Uncharacterized protein n=1 Tax=Fusarium piperis TaxID=1435070 RepID=A0A9W8TFE6_9HYPO|nr:hypothetical protein N0V84_010479 [Fusarium piperis]